MEQGPPKPDPLAPATDSENLRRLRNQARQRLEAEESENAPPLPAPVYGGAPAPVYGGPPGPFSGGRRRRRWLRPLILLVSAILAILAWLFFRGIVAPAPVYGGPPVRIPGAPAALLAIRRFGRRLW